MIEAETGISVGRRVRPVLEDAHAGGQQFAVEPAARQAHELLIRMSPRHDHPYPHVPPSGLHERTSHRMVGEEVWRADVDPPNRSFNQHLKDDARRRGAVRR